MRKVRAGERATSLWAGMEAPSSLFGRPDSAQARQYLTRVGPETETHLLSSWAIRGRLTDWLYRKKADSWLATWLAGWETLAGRHWLVDVGTIAVPTDKTRPGKRQLP